MLYKVNKQVQWEIGNFRSKKKQGQLAAPTDTVSWEFDPHNSADLQNV